jgi:DNA-binding CsgD family transcriptional regulator
LGQRAAWQAQAEYFLAKGLPEQALEILNRLAAFTPPDAPNYRVTLPTLLRGKVLMALNRNQEAAASLLATRQTLENQAVQPTLWRVNLALAEVYLRLKQREAASEAAQAARNIIAEIAAALDDETLRERFRQQALAQTPAIPAPSERQAAKKAWAGLTEREREVALLVAQGKTNREIAEALILNKRTVESYLDHIFLKLNFSSRVQLAAWVFERGGLVQNT